MSFLGSCLYFRTINQEPKEIPPDIVDIGCDLYRTKLKQNHPLLTEVVKTFKGTVL